MSKKLVVSCAAFSAFALSTPAMASRNLQCDKMQTHCVVGESTDLTIGDKVGIFNDDGELVATGEVRAMRGERRAVLINERHGSIHKNYKLALLDRSEASDASGSNVAAYKVYREPPKVDIGASIGYSTVSIGDGSPATEFSVFGQVRKWGGLQLVGRAVYMAMEGQLTRYTAGGTDNLPISVSGMGLLGGIGYVAREGQTVSFRGELAAGGMDVNATVGGDKSLVDSGQTNARVKNGFGAYGRAALGPVLNMDSWHFHLDYAPSLVYQAFANTLAAGVSKDLK
jgi:hypothetical protein